MAVIVAAIVGVVSAVAAPIAGALALGSIAGVLVAGLALTAIGSLFSSKPSGGGSQTKWKADPYAGIPYVMGRTLTSGNIVYRRGHGGNNKFQTFVTVLSLGTILSIDSAFADKLAISFDSGGNATGQFHNQIYERRQLGALPESAALSPPIDTPPGWTSAHKLSGLAAVMNTYVYDSQNKNGLTYVPQPAWIVHGVKVYDPRLDSTYPGGSGSCRAGVESTYVGSENPHLHALTWCLGRFHNGVRVAGIGATTAQIDVAAFVEGANLDDARSWKVGGQVYTRPDTLWNSLKAILQAGGAAPVMIGGRITCINRAPRVSLATITRADIVGACSFAATQPIRSRINAIIPQYRSEAHDWELVPAARVAVAAYATLDGDERTRELTYPLVQDVNQVAQIATYDICDAREAGPGQVPLKPAWLNYRIGDCVTFSPEDGAAIKALVTGRALDAQTGAVTFTLRGETDGKHAFALGQTGTAPPIASLTYSNLVPAPGSGEWSLSGTSLSAAGSYIPTLVVTGACANTSANEVLVDYRVHTSGLGDEDNWVGAASGPPTLTTFYVNPVLPNTSYDVSVRYRVRGVLGARLILGAATSGNHQAQTIAGQAATATSSDFAVVTGSTKPSDNADVTAAAQLVTSVIANKTIASDYTGTITGVLSDVVWAPTVTRGGGSIVLDNATTYALSNTSGGTFAVDNTNGSATKGQVTISAMTANTAQADLTVSVSGVQVSITTLRLDKTLGAPPSGGGAVGKTVNWTTPDFVVLNTTSYTQVATPVKTVALASGESLYGTAPLTYIVSGSGFVTRTMSFKWQYSVAGAGSWNDFDTAITGGTAVSRGDATGYITFSINAIPGAVSVTQTKAGLSAGNYDVQLVAVVSATGRSMTTSGSASVEAKV